MNVISSSVGIRKPLVAVMTLRAGCLDARYVRPFRYPLDCVFFIELRLCHLRGQCLLCTSLADKTDDNGQTGSRPIAVVFYTLFSLALCGKITDALLLT